MPVPLVDDINFAAGYGWRKNINDVFHSVGRSGNIGGTGYFEI